VEKPKNEIWLWEEVKNAHFLPTMGWKSGAQRKQENDAASIARFQGVSGQAVIHRHGAGILFLRVECY